MPLVVNTNVGAMNAQRYLSSNTGALSKSMEKLASGYRINRAGDDAAGENSVPDTLNNVIDGLPASLTEFLFHDDFRDWHGPRSFGRVRSLHPILDFGEGPKIV